MDHKSPSVTVIIPARYDSSRLPGKPILERVREVTGKYLVQHVYERAAAAPGVAAVIVATDDARIFEAVEAFGGRAAMTSPDHKCGTERVAEVAEGLDSEVIVNVQGDEPMIRSDQVEQVARLLTEEPEAVMGTLATPIRSEEEWRDPSVVKVVVDKEGYALYFSRSPIPYVRDSADWLKDSPTQPLHHLGVYSYRRDFLLRYAHLPPAPLEKAEKLEQLRALSAGYEIRVAITPHECVGIDTPEELERWLARYR